MPSDNPAWPFDHLPAPEQGPKAVAVGERAMVSTSHPMVTEAAVQVLRDGGNAVDALLTAMPLQHVVEPHMSTLAGGFGLVYWEAASGRAYYLNAELDRPAGGPIPPRDAPEESGQRIAVPGTVRGMQALAERFGTRPWASYFEPAIKVADDGFPMYSFLYGEMAASYDRLTHYPSGRAFYTPAGYLTPVGHLHRQPALAAALRRLAQPDGVEWFQRGEWAQRFVAAVQQTGGSVTLEDMASYEPRWAEPLRFRAFGYDLLGGDAPEYGAAFMGIALGILERAGIDPAQPWHGSSRATALVARALGVAMQYTARYCQDPTAFAVPFDILLSDEFLSLQARLLTESFPTVDLPLPDDNLVAAPPQPGPGSTDSNHIVIVDAAGNWLTMLHTVYGTPFGTGLVVDGISVNSGNSSYFGGVSVGPGRRITTPLAPVLVLRDGRPWIGIGSPGAACQAVTLVLLNLLHHGMDLGEAIDAPRLQLRAEGGRGMGWEIGTIAVETRFPEATLRGLARLGIDVASLGDYNWHMGSVQTVMRDESGRLLGAADPRRGGHAAGF